MTSLEIKILIDRTFSTAEDYENLIAILDPAISLVPSAFKKKVLICCTELIQNNHIHNPGTEISLLIFTVGHLLKIEATQIVTENVLNLISEKIKKLNALSIEELTLLYRENLTTSETIRHQGQQTTGNGLITCRLKSQNPLQLILINSNQNTEYRKQIMISLTFNLIEKR